MFVVGVCAEKGIAAPHFMVKGVIGVPRIENLLIETCDLKTRVAGIFKRRRVSRFREGQNVNINPHQSEQSYSSTTIIYFIGTAALPSLHFRASCPGV